MGVGVTGREREGSEGLRDCGCRCGCVYTRACVDAGEREREARGCESVGVYTWPCVNAGEGEREESKGLRDCGCRCGCVYTRACVDAVERERERESRGCEIVGVSVGVCTRGHVWMLGREREARECRCVCV